MPFILFSKELLKQSRLNPLNLDFWIDNIFPLYWNTPLPFMNLSGEVYKQDINTNNEALPRRMKNNKFSGSIETWISTTEWWLYRWFKIANNKGTIKSIDEMIEEVIRPSLEMITRDIKNKTRFEDSYFYKKRTPDFEYVKKVYKEIESMFNMFAKWTSYED